MVIDDRRLDRVGQPFTIEIAEQFLLFGVDADYWLTCVELRILERGDLFKLSVTVSVLPHRAFLLRLATTKAFVEK